MLNTSTSNEFIQNSQVNEKLLNNSRSELNNPSRINDDIRLSIEE